MKKIQVKNKYVIKIFFSGIYRLRKEVKVRKGEEMTLKIINQDITTLKVDAIVNAANKELEQGGGVCGAIFKAAGPDKLKEACRSQAPIVTGEAVITMGFDLPATYIIHTAGPVYKDGESGEKEQLRACYLNSLQLAKDHDCKSIAFPLISSGIYGYPKEEAKEVAISAIEEFLEKEEMKVFLVIFE